MKLAQDPTGELQPEHLGVYVVLRVRAAEIATRENDDCDLRPKAGRSLRAGWRRRAASLVEAASPSS